MPFADSHGVRIYYEMAGSGPTVTLAHGLLGSVDLWHKTGYIGHLKDWATAIAFDARGHGRSDRPHCMEAYDYPVMADDVVAVLDAAGVEHTHYWGYSMGGLMGYVVADRSSERLNSLILGGACPVPPPGQRDEHGRRDGNPSVALFQKGVDEGPEALGEAIETLVGPMPAPFKNSLRTVDFEAMVAYSKCQRIELKPLAAAIDLPTLFYSGDGEPESHRHGEEEARVRANAEFVSLRGLNHLTASDAVDQIAPAVREFVERVEGEVSQQQQIGSVPVLG